MGITHSFHSSDLDTANKNTHRAVCDMYTAQQRLLDYLLVVSNDFYMKDIPQFVIRNILLYCSNVIVATDEVKRCRKYADSVRKLINANGIS